jgi:hypothetical protein
LFGPKYPAGPFEASEFQNCVCANCPPGLLIQQVSDTALP